MKDKQVGFVKGGGEGDWGRRGLLLPPAYKPPLHPLKRSSDYGPLHLRYQSKVRSQDYRRKLQLSRREKQEQLRKELYSHLFLLDYLKLSKYLANILELANGHVV